MKLIKQDVLLEMFNDLTTNKIWESRDYGYWINNYYWIDYLIDKYFLEQTKKSKYDYQFDLGKYEKGQRLEITNTIEIIDYIENKVLEAVKLIILDKKLFLEDE